MADRRRLGEGWPVPLEKATYPPGFTRASSIATWKGSEPRAASEANLLARDKAFSTAAAAKGAASACASVMHPEARFQRPGFLPMRSREAAVEWIKQHVKEWSTEPTKSETAASGDFGDTWGKYQVTPTDRAAYSGCYVRVWTRKADGEWQLVAETLTPPPAVRRKNKERRAKSE